MGQGAAHKHTREVLRAATAPVGRGVVRRMASERALTCGWHCPRCFRRLAVLPAGNLSPPRLRFTDKVTEAQRGKGTCQGLCSWDGGEREFESELFGIDQTNHKALAFRVSGAGVGEGIRTPLGTSCVICSKSPHLPTCSFPPWMRGGHIPHSVAMGTRADGTRKTLSTLPGTQSTLKGRFK